MRTITTKHLWKMKQEQQLKKEGDLSTTKLKNLDMSDKNKEGMGQEE